MKITHSVLLSMASCITFTRLLPIARRLGAVSLYLVDRISFSPQSS